MTDIDLDGNLQPVWTETKNYRKINGQALREQRVRLSATSKLYNISSEYQSDLIPNKIEKEIRNVARELDFISSVADVEVEQKDNVYEVSIKLRQIDDIDISLDNI